MDMAAIWINFRAPSHSGSIWNLALIGPVISEEKMFEGSGRRMPAYTINSPLSLWLRWANKQRILHEWSFHMKFMKRACGEFHEFHMKLQQV